MKKKSAFIALLGNINYDSRALNLYTSLTENGYSVKAVSFDWLTDGFKPQTGDVSVYKLKKGFLSLTFYLKFKIILLSRLIFSKADLYFAEDIYTLPLVLTIGKLKRGRVFYDSRELYGYLAGLRERKYIQFILKIIEKYFIYIVDTVIVTGDMDAKFLIKEYNIGNILVIRNLPLNRVPASAFDFHGELNIQPGKKILLYQGVILHGRGLRIIYEALPRLKDFVLVVLGGGEQKEYYESLAKEKGLEKQVIFFGKVDQKDLLLYTAGADIGLALIENISLSYYYALPNKLFEYILAGVPAIVSDLPQMRKVVDEFKIGRAADIQNIDSVVNAIKEISSNDRIYNEYIENCRKAAEVLNWDEEIKKLFSLIGRDRP